MECGVLQGAEEIEAGPARTLARPMRDVLGWTVSVPGLAASHRLAG